MGVWASKTLQSAVELELFTKLEELGPRTDQELEKLLGLNDGSAQKFLDTLVEFDVLEREDGRYYNSVEASMFLDRQKSSYVGGLLKLANHQLFGFWNELTRGVDDCRAQAQCEKAGARLENLDADPEQLAEFLASMTCVSHAANQTIARRFGWEEYESFLDVGCAPGDLAVQVVLTNPHIRATGLDLPAVECAFKRYMEAHGVLDRISFVGGDVWNEDFPSADVITMGHLLGDWMDDRKVELIQKAFESLNPGGALIVYESFPDEYAAGRAFDVLASSDVPTGVDRGCGYSAADCVGWMEDAGFERCRVEQLVGTESMVVGYK